MAIKKLITLKSGIVLADAYHRIIETSLRKNINSDVSNMGIMVVIYKDAQARIDKIPVKEFGATIIDEYPNSEFTTFLDTSVLNQEGVNFLKQCYEWMKTKSDLEGIDYTENTEDV